MDDILTTDEAAKILRVSEETIRRYLRAGQLRGVKWGKSWRIRRSALEGIENVTRAREKQVAPLTATEIKAKLALMDKLEALVEGLPDRRREAGLPPLTEQNIFEALYE